MFELPDWMRGITLGQVVVLIPLAVAAHSGLDWMIRNAVADEKFVTQEALDAQALKLEAVEKAISELEKSSGILESDIGTVKALQKESRDDIQDILKGINRLSN
jgi:hypothetical protein